METITMMDIVIIGGLLFLLIVSIGYFLHASIRKINEDISFTNRRMSNAVCRDDLSFVKSHVRDLEKTIKEYERENREKIDLLTQHLDVAIIKRPEKYEVVGKKK